MIYVSLHSHPSSPFCNFGIPHANDTVLVLEGNVSDRIRWDGGGSRGVGVEGILRK